MREIKFRAWDKRSQTMRHGYPVIKKGVFDSFVEDVTGSILGAAYWPMVLMHFTGLNDRSGREIYEGDIVIGFGEAPKKKHVVTWERDHHGWYPFAIFTLDSMYHRNADFSHVDVIGNIHENPDLVKA